MTKRTYSSRVRAVAAGRTHTAILRAAEELFVVRGYTRTTLSAIAERAGVALNTVYTSVGGKPALVDALAREGTEDEGIGTSLTALLASTDCGEILRLTAEATGMTTRRHERVLNFLRDNAASNPAVATAAEHAVERYHERLTLIAEHLVTLRETRPDAVRTEQILWFHFGQESWRTVRGFGWTWEDCATWLASRAADALLSPSVGRDD
ncbi:TetR/AcrR family transcriptional regulator [Streptomyces sp. NPDC057428]|uniref:TetR/AcrR family transcriptional regulator n=1 Tax=Streptomyces sp. NPDC057428 TaxID=3346129 RepID=UPI0036B98B22